MHVINGSSVKNWHTAKPVFHCVHYSREREKIYNIIMHDSLLIAFFFLWRCRSNGIWKDVEGNRGEPWVMSTGPALINSELILYLKLISSFHSINIRERERERDREKKNISKKGVRKRSVKFFCWQKFIIFIDIRAFFLVIKAPPYNAHAPNVIHWCHRNVWFIFNGLITIERQRHKGKNSIGVQLCNTMRTDENKRLMLAPKNSFPSLPLPFVLDAIIASVCS